MQTEWQTGKTLIRLLPAAVWSGSTLFTPTCLSENLGSLQYLFVSSQQLVYFLVQFIFTIFYKWEQNAMKFSTTFLINEAKMTHENLLIIPYQLTKFQASSSNSFWYFADKF